MQTEHLKHISCILAVSLTTVELPIILFMRSNHKLAGLQYNYEGNIHTVALTKEKHLDHTELENAFTALFLFQLICVAECLAIPVKTAINTDFAASMDRLPKNYSTLWLAFFDCIKHDVVSL